MSKAPDIELDLGSSEIVSALFTEERLKRTIKRMADWRDRENEVTHPLRRVVLTEFAEELSVSISEWVTSGSYRPGAAYPMMVKKRTGTFRDLVFPDLLDTIIGRHIIDALEARIVEGDNNQAFFGRSHANATRERGDYENWFQVWLDYSASVGRALEDAGYAYVFQTDITDFFPSVDLELARQLLAQRTGAHFTLLGLLFECLDAWAARLGYSRVPGLPVEPNDISRLIAHNFLKSVDKRFMGRPDQHYLRWVDDTVVFVRDHQTAEEVMREHHMQLRQLGLAPNASKTSIVTASEFAEGRHPEFNRAIDAATNAADVPALVSDWYSDRDRPSWDKVAKRLYSLARKHGSPCMRGHVLQDVQDSPRLITAALGYLQGLEVSKDELAGLIEISGQRTASVEVRMEIARFLGDAVLEQEADVKSLVEYAIGQTMSADQRLGAGYARGLLLLVVNKYGNRVERDRLLAWATPGSLADEQLRHHFLYVMLGRGETLPDPLTRSLRHLNTRDIELTVRVLSDAKDGQLRRLSRIHADSRFKAGGGKSLRARNLPLLAAACVREGPQYESHVKWLRKQLDDPELCDPAVRTQVHRMWESLTS